MLENYEVGGGASSCARVPAELMEPESATIEYVTFAAREVLAVTRGVLRVNVEVRVKSGDSRGAAVAFRMPIRNGPWGYWELPYLSDNRGDRKHLHSYSIDRLHGAGANDWLIMRGGQTGTLVMDFSDGFEPCTNTLALHADVHVVWLDA